MVYGLLRMTNPLLGALDAVRDAHPDVLPPHYFIDTDHLKTLNFFRLRRSEQCRLTPLGVLTRKKSWAN